MRGDAMSQKQTFCLTTTPFAYGWYALVTLWMVPVRRCNLVETLLKNSRPSSFIWMEKQPCPHITSYKNCETVVAFLSLSGFTSDHLLKWSIHTTKQQYPSTSVKLQISTPILFIIANATGILSSSVFVLSVKLPCFWHVIHFFTKSATSFYIEHQKIRAEINYKFITGRISSIMWSHWFYVWAFCNPLK